MTLAEQLLPQIAKRYYTNMLDFLPTVSDKTKQGYCKYRITFTDKSTLDVVLTSAQRNGIVRSKLYNNIKCIGGMGYMKPFHTPNELPKYFEPGLLHIVFRNESQQDFIGKNGYGNITEAETAAQYYIEGKFKFTNSRVVGAYICQSIVPVY